jgi:hypothetical protein
MEYANGSIAEACPVVPSIVRWVTERVGPCSDSNATVPVEVEVSNARIRVMRRL